ncbi:MAG: isopentenyl-diphosphate delta-isomerase [Pseudomonadota bacterium]|jgi:isopentenyl-diphosphate delta-isomerase
MDLTQFETRKRDHISQALDLRNQAQGWTGLEQVRLRHEALPELDFSEIDLSEEVFSQRLKTPFFIAGMTMGHPDAAAINTLLARAAARRGWVMGVGSQRRELEGRALPDEAKSLRREAPDAVLISNLGLSQVIRASSQEIRAVLEALEPQALVVHLNVLQEALQPEGTPQFRGGLEAIARLVRDLPIPVMVKETGCGFSESTLDRLASIGVAAIDVSGLGGTHWGRIEGARSPVSSFESVAAKVFADWGESTVSSVRAAAEVLSKNREARYSIWASGGVRSGLDAAKLIALGAHRVGYAQPALQAAMGGEDVLNRWMEQQEFELRVALFCTGCASPKELRAKEGSWNYGRS